VLIDDMTNSLCNSSFFSGNALAAGAPSSETVRLVPYHERHLVARVMTCCGRSTSRARSRMMDKQRSTLAPSRLVIGVVIMVAVDVVAVRSMVVSVQCRVSGMITVITVWMIQSPREPAAKQSQSWNRISWRIS
jgi:hypothetical protein